MQAGISFQPTPLQSNSNIHGWSFERRLRHLLHSFCALVAEELLHILPQITHKTTCMVNAILHGTKFSSSSASGWVVSSLQNKSAEASTFTKIKTRLIACYRSDLPDPWGIQRRLELNFSDRLRKWFPAEALYHSITLGPAKKASLKKKH